MIRLRRCARKSWSAQIKKTNTIAACRLKVLTTSYRLYSKPLISVWVLIMGGEGVGKGLGGVCMEEGRVPSSRWFEAVMVTMFSFNFSGGVSDPGIRGCPVPSENRKSNTFLVHIPCIYKMIKMTLPKSPF